MAGDGRTDPGLVAWIGWARPQLSLLQDSVLVLGELVQVEPPPEGSAARATEVLGLCDELVAWVDRQPAPAPLLEAESELRAAAAVLRNAAFVARREPREWAAGALDWRLSLTELLTRASSHVAASLSLIGILEQGI